VLDGGSCGRTSVANLDNVAETEEEEPPDDNTLEIKDVIMEYVQTEDNQRARSFKRKRRLKRSKSQGRNSTNVEHRRCRVLNQVQR
jgi:hypothetical protein